MSVKRYLKTIVILVLLADLIRLNVNVSNSHLSKFIEIGSQEKGEPKLLL